MTPKQRFQTLAAASKSHFDLTETDNFKAAMDAALLQHIENVAQPTFDPQSAIAGYNRIVGAVQFAKTLMNLGTKEVPQTIKDDGLNYRLK